MKKCPIWLKYFLWIGFSIILGGVLTGCGGLTDTKDPGQWQPTVANCWPCALYGSVFQIIDELARTATVATLPVARAILGIGLSFYLAFQVGKMLLPFTATKDMVKMGHEAMFVFLKAIMVYILFANVDLFLLFIKEVVIMPVGQFFTILSNAILESMPGTGEYFGAMPGITPDMNKMVVDISGRMVEVDTSVSMFDTLGIQVQYIVSRIFKSLQSGGALVEGLLSRPGFYNWLIGLVAGYQIWALMTMFPLAFVDSFIQISYVIILAPIVIALWVFPKQDKYLKAIFPSKLLGPFMDVLFGCIFIVLMITTLQIYANICLGGLLNPVTNELEPGWVENAAAGGPNIIIMALLIMSISKMSFAIYDFTTLFGGSPGSGSLMELMDKARALLRKAALALVTGGASASMEAKKMAQEAAVKAASSGSSDGSGGGSS